MDQDEIAVIIPCYNEAQTIGKVVDDFHRELPEATVYVYDNNSTDGTAEIVGDLGFPDAHFGIVGSQQIATQGP